MSFAKALQAHFGPAYTADYLDIHFLNDVYFYERRMPEKFKRVPVGSKTKIIHGHMLLGKWVSQFSPLANTYITWLRHPVKRLASHYQYMHDRKGAASPSNRVWEVIFDKWSFEQFCFSDVYRDYMVNYTCGVPLSMFKFVGICEHFHEDFKYFFNTYCDSDPEVVDINKTSSRLPEVERCMSDSAFVNAVLNYHSRDAAFYQEALERRLKERG